ncbi:NAD(P)H-binding protein [Alistipes sp. ZOR0009]|uniref:NAD(P)H-binding protein n=1 Tax=Alistipes sp. ZOR0009 TaxID=1339253 RepID=UPI0006483EBB|nr:NAD(P)H-binding protein [Alistipes sp. ZOR0009]
MNTKIAIVIGGTGLVGTALLEQLVADERYAEIVAIGRRKPSVESQKITFIENTLEKPKSAAEHLFGDDLFICIGTTIKKAKSQENFKYVDYTIPKKIAKHARKNGVKNIAVVSSVGAQRKSNNFYLKTKGKMEEAIIAEAFRRTVVLRPSLLLGKRKEHRLAESIGHSLSGVLNLLMVGKLRKYRAVKATDVAAAMIKYINVDTVGTDIIHYDYIIK